jgi:hypothetical protein
MSFAVKSILCIPVSNADVERIFSNIHNIKTSDKNRFDTNSIKHFVTCQESFKDMNGCKNFRLTMDMFKSFNENIYKKKE